MPFYHQLGKIPPKRHTQFRKEDGSLTTSSFLVPLGLMGWHPFCTMSKDPRWSEKLENSILLLLKLPRVITCNLIGSEDFKFHKSPII